MSEEPASARPALETIGGAVAIATVLLTATGFASRFAAFVAGPGLDSTSTWPLVVASSATLAEFAFWGFVASVIALPVLAYFYWFVALLAHPRVKAQPPPSRRGIRNVRALGFILLAVFLLLTPSFPVYWLVIPTAMVASLVIRRGISEGRRLAFVESWWVFAAFLLVSGVLLGLTGIVPGQAIANYRFTAESRLTEMVPTVRWVIRTVSSTCLAAAPNEAWLS
jgi:hypothetical protein